MRNRAALAALGAALLLGGLWWWQAAHRGPLVVYCAHDATSAEPLLREFEKRSGMPVVIRYATGAAQSPGLAELFMGEKDAPRCDVFWSDDFLDTLDLQQRGLLQPYQGSGFARIPAAFKATDGSWTGFAARLRVVLYNTAKIGTTPPNLDALVPGSDLSRIAIAQPLHGTALAHYTVLWHLWGGEKLKAWHRQWRQDGVKEFESDAAVKDAVAAGTCFAGFADTNDYFAAKEDGSPVAMRPVRLEDGKTICIPNTVAILRGSRHKKAAHQLVDFLLSQETELALANSKARQIPLGPVPVEQLPADVREPAQWARDGIDLAPLDNGRTECLAWLKAEYPP